jgi:1-acyl-sn-glycerol-3-phosphate acyltransferase
MLGHIIRCPGYPSRFPRILKNYGADHGPEARNKVDMKRHSPAFYQIYRILLKLLLAVYLRFGYKLKKTIPPGPKIFVGNHPTVWDVFPTIVLFKRDIIHTLIEDQIWSFPLVRLILSLTNQVKMNHGVESMQSLREALYWLNRGHSLVVAAEGERTSVSETRHAARGIVWLAVHAKVPLVPVGLWISDQDLYTKDVRYHFKGRSYTVESFFPRFRGKFFWLFGEAISLDQYYGKRLSPKQRQEIADSVLDNIYRLKEETKRICKKTK